jgi:ribonuclease P protein component
MGSGRGCAPGLVERSLADDGRKAGPGSAPRLGRSGDIARILRTGSPHRSRRVVLYVAPGTGPSRAAWVTGRRVGSAVARNRARRLLREAWRELAARVPVGYELVLVARGPFGEAKASDVVEEVEGLLRRAGVMQA